MGVNSRSSYYDNLKFFLIVLVVAGHFIEPLIPSSRVAEVLKDWIYLFHMPAFLFVSGIFAKKIYEPGRGLRVNTVAFYLVLYVLFFCASTAWRQMLGLSPSLNILKVGSVPWYLLAMALYSLTIPAVVKIKGGLKVVVTTSVVLAVLAGFNNDIGNFLTLGRVIVFSPFYYLGYFTGIKEFELYVLQLKKKKWPVICSALLIGVSFLYMWFIPEPLLSAYHGLVTANNPYQSLDYYPSIVDALVRISHLLLASSLTFATCLLVPISKTWFSELGAQTLQVYILHAFIYYFLKGYDPCKEFLASSPNWMIFLVIALSILTVVLLSRWKLPTMLINWLRQKINVES